MKRWNMGKKWILAAAIVLAGISSCRNPVGDYVAWLYRYMPLPDSLQYDRSYWEANVKKTLQVRRRMAWDIPEREFRHFVLPLRVNNEALDDFRTQYADTLCARISGLPLAEAALEINHWCHEQATYEPSDARTGAPEEIMLRGVGRCGEESVLAVAALRAAGIPARQVYTPRWAHTDDNHAWVEVWTGDGWHFMGACEPEPTLDRAWFNSSVSRAMILHTKVYGDYQGEEDVIKKTPCYTEINVIRGYVPARKSTVTVLEDGKAAAGASVSFRIYNYAEFYNVVTYKADEEGRTSLDMGLGDMFVLAWKGNRFGYGVVSGDSLTVELNHTFGEAFADELTITPPPEQPLPSSATEEMIAANAERLVREDAIRSAHDHVNHAVERFLAEHPGRGEEVLSLLSEKDRADVRYDALVDFLSGTGSGRVELEPLRPYRKAILESEEVSGLRTREEVMDWCRRNITVDDSRNPQRLRTSPAAVWQSRKADSLGFNIFYVGLCRALGIDARYDAVTGRVEQDTPKAFLVPDSDRYFKDYTLTRFSPEGTTLLDYEESGLPEVLAVDPGYYLLTTGRRLADGSVLVRLAFFALEEGERRALSPVVRDAGDRPSVIGTMDVEPLLPQTGRGFFLVAVLGDKDEPSSHARRELEAASTLLETWGRPVVILPADDPVLQAFPEPRTVPVVAICDSFGRIFYLSRGYNTSLAADLGRILPHL